MEYFAISTFLEQVSKLTKKPKDGYNGLISEICSDFCQKTKDEIYQNRDMIYNSDKYDLIKLRLKDSKNGLSKRDGYRLLYLLLRETDRVVFLDVYPKRGANGLNNVSDEWIKHLLTTFLKEIDCLNHININDNLNLISKEAND